MRASLRWLLALTVFLSAWALWWPGRQATIVEAVQQSRKADSQEVMELSRTVVLPVSGGPEGGSGFGSRLPVLWPSVVLAPTRRDPFATDAPKAPLTMASPAKVSPVVVPQQPVARAPPVSAEPTMAQAPPPAPIAPSVNLRYLGYMKAPGGENVVLLADGEASIPVRVGAQVASGYVVQAIGQNVVRLIYPATGTLVDVPIPPPPFSASDRP